MGNHMVSRFTTYSDGAGNDEKQSIAFSDGSATTEITPIKVLINEQLTSTAVDSLRDSQLIANQSAKNLIIELFRDSTSTKKFGELLNYTFSYESVLKPSRDLVYWSMKSDMSLQSIDQQAKSALLDFMGTKGSGKQEVLKLSSHWLRQPETRQFTMNPLIAWACVQPAVTLNPLTEIVVHVLPLTKPAVVDSFKYWAGVALQSEDIKKVAKDGLVDYLQKVNNRSTAAAAGTAPGGHVTAEE